MQRFHEPIRQSATHVYVSAIPLFPSSSILFKTYASKLRNIPKLLSGSVTHAALIVLRPDRGFTVDAFSPDCSWFVYAAENKLSIWDVTTCTPIRESLAGHDARISMIKFSPDGSKFVSLDDAGRVLVWDATIYEAIRVPIQLSVPACLIGFVADGVIFNEEGRIRLWDITTGKTVVDYNLEVARSEYGRINGTYVVISSSDFIPNVHKIIHVVTGADVTTKYTHGRTIVKVKFSSDHARVVCLHDDYFCRIMDVLTGDVIGDPIVVHSTVDYRFEISANGRLLVGQGNCPTIYNVGTGKLEDGPLERDYWISGMALSFDETRLLIWGGGCFEVLDMPSGTVVAAATETLIGGFISSDGNRVIRRDLNEIAIFDVTSLSDNHRNVSRLVSVTPSPTGQQLLFTHSDNSLSLAVDISFTGILSGARSPAAFSSDGSTIVSAHMDHTLQLWHSKDASLMGNALRGHQKPITAVAFSPTGDRLISASQDCTIRIWAPSGAGELLRLQAYSDILSISLSSDQSRIICVSEIGAVRTLNANTGLVITHTSRYNWRWAEFLPDGKTAICVSDNGQSRLVDSQTGQITEHSTLRRTRGFNSVNLEFNSVNFSPTATHFISINRADTIEFSNTTTSCEQSSDICSRSIRSLAFSSSGRWMVSTHKITTGMFRVCMWDSQSGLLVWEDTLDEYGDHPVVVISPSGDMTVTLHEYGVCRVRNTSLGTMISCWRTKSSPRSIVFCPEEKKIILKESWTTEEWDIESGTMVDSYNGSSSLLNPGTCSPFLYKSIWK
jgi:WD40 repeat protein